MVEKVKSVVTTTYVDDILRNVDKAHLIEAIRLIACNLAHIRKLVGITPSFTMTEGLDSRGKEDRKQVEEMTQRLILDALGTTAACDSSVPRRERSISSANKTIDSDQRLHIRITTALPISARRLDTDQYLAAMLWDMSWGGVRISCDDLDAEVGDDVELKFAGPENIPIKARAIVQRKIETESPAHKPVIQYALQFAEFSLQSDQQFRELLQRTLHTLEQQGCLQDPQFAYQLDLEFTDRDDLARLLENIPHGQAEIMLPAPMRLHDRIIFAICAPSGSNALDLRANVVKQELVVVSGVALYRVNFEFEHPKDELSERVKRILAELNSK